jgi:hypothetical protein
MPMSAAARCRTLRIGGDGLEALVVLGGPGRRAALDEAAEPVGEDLRVDPEVAVIAQVLGHGVGHRADADLERGGIGNALRDEARDRVIGLGDHGRRRGDQRIVGLDPPEHPAEMQLVLARRARHAGVRLDEDRDVTGERGTVIGVRPQRDPPVPVRGRRGDDEQRIGRVGAQQRGHAAQVVGHELHRAALEVLAERRREEVGDVAEPVAERARVMRAVAERVELVDPYVLEPAGLGLDGIEHGARLAVRRGNDEVGAGRDVVEHRARVGDGPRNARHGHESLARRAHGDEGRPQTENPGRPGRSPGAVTVTPERVSGREAVEEAHRVRSTREGARWMRLPEAGPGG